MDVLPADVPCVFRMWTMTAKTLQSFEFFGPTCDSADRMRGPFLPSGNVREGEWVEIGQLGASGAALRTGFNGFDRAIMVEVRDRPLIGETAAPPMIVEAA
jgi:diaminopimelate decarboxylase